MKKSISFLSLGFVIVSWSGCAGIKVVNPNDANKNAGTKALDLSSGTPRFVSTHTCNLESTGNRFSAIGKSEEEARKEVLAKCRDHAMLSFCKADQIACVKN